MYQVEDLLEEINSDDKAQIETKENIPSALDENFIDLEGDEENQDKKVTGNILEAIGNENDEDFDPNAEDDFDPNEIEEKENIKEKVDLNEANKAINILADAFAFSKSSTIKPLALSCRGAGGEYLKQKRIEFKEEIEELTKLNEKKKEVNK